MSAGRASASAAWAAAAMITMLCSIQPAGALKCRWPSPPVARAIFPARGSTILWNGSIFVRTRLPASDFVLVEQGTNRRLAVVGQRGRLAHLLVIRPARPLAAGRTFELRLKKGVAGETADLVYSPGVVVVFKTSSELGSDGAPSRLNRPEIKFSPVRRGQWVGVGRSAHVLVSARSGSHPVVVEVLVELWSKETKQVEKRSFTQAYTTPRTYINVASMGKCSRIHKAPASGRFKIVVVPWTVTGKEGRQSRHSGRIR